MNFEFIEQIRSRLLSELRRTLEPLALVDLAAVTEAQDELLRLYLEETIIANCARIFAQAEWLSNDRRMLLNDAHYELIVRESVPLHDTIEVWLIQRDPGSRPTRPRPHHLNWNTAGKYAKALLYIAPEIKAEPNILAELVAAVFSTGYAWYHEQLHILLGDEKLTAKRLYSFLRTIMPDERVLERVWLVSADADYGCYLVDERLATAALDRVRPKASELGKSAIRILSEFVTSTLPFELTHSRAAVSLNKCVDVNLDDSRYSREKALFMAGEIVLYGSPWISIFPILRSGNAFLLAVFPTADRMYLEPILSNHQQELSAEFEHFRSSLVRLLATLRAQRRGLLTSRIGELTGSILGGLLKALGNP